ncbi:hypothetical protein [Geosporobacter ferrireducens]|uniref:hypothetical protein n=1 Tax=Geosporobacter ferrireducens TaxID=1424294 RepID=UPI001A9A58C9|nr:hypothetical protein [Geosporobacter ferrireducens]
MQYADEAVVVTKPKPMKGSNSMEGKTQVTYYRVDMAIVGQKFTIDAKGGRDFKVYQKEF